MSDDLIERLRGSTSWNRSEVSMEAADEIELLQHVVNHGYTMIAALKAEVKQLEAELKEAIGVKELWEKTAKNLGAVLDERNRQEPVVPSFPNCQEDMKELGVDEIERSCCGTFFNTPHRSTCKKFRGKK